MTDRVIIETEVVTKKKYERVVTNQYSCAGCAFKGKSTLCNRYDSLCTGAIFKEIDSSSPEDF